MYDPTAGVFLTDDPEEYLSADANFRRYVGNSPTDRIDPTGLMMAPVAPEERPKGTKENGFDGDGEWEFKSEEELIAFLEALLDSENNELPENWIDVAKNGCVGLARLRVGWTNEQQLGKPIFLIPGSFWYTTFDAAEKKLEALEAAHPGKKYIIVAAQLPTTVIGANLAKLMGDGPIDCATDRLFNKYLDLNRAGDFNFLT